MGEWVSLAPVELVETGVGRGFDTLNQQTPTGFNTVNHNRWSISSRPRSAGVFDTLNQTVAQPPNTDP